MIRGRAAALARILIIDDDNAVRMTLRLLLEGAAHSVIAASDGHRGLDRLNAEAFDDDGYFRTGDLGTLDADGYVVITGRSKDVIIRNAENISAKEVEDLLYTHPKVLDVAVVGLSDAKTGERVCAVVASSDANDPLTVDDMRDFLREQGLRRQAVPEQLELVDVIPRNAAGKVTKNVLRDRFNNQPRNQ